MPKQPAIRTGHLGWIYRLKPNRKQRREARKEGRTTPLPTELVALEDVFMKLVGRGLDEDTNDE